MVRRNRRQSVFTPSRVIIGSTSAAGFVIMTAAMGPLVVPPEPALLESDPTPSSEPARPEAPTQSVGLPSAFEDRAGFVAPVIVVEVRRRTPGVEEVVSANIAPAPASQQSAASQPPPAAASPPPRTAAPPPPPPAAPAQSSAS